MSEIRDPENPLEGMTPGIGEPVPEPIKPAWYQGLPDDSNPYAARLRGKPELGVISNVERAALNARSSFYGGTLTGSVLLKNLHDIVGADVRPGGYVTPEKQESARAELERIREDKARYESVPAFSGPMEGAAAFAGQLAGAAASPESWITKFPGATWAVGKVFGQAADTVAARIVDSALSQGAINLVTDPLAQAGSLITGLQGSYDYGRTALAAPMGAIFGGAFQGGAEAARAFRGRAPEIPVPRETPAAVPSAGDTPGMPAAAAIQDPSVRIEPASPAADVARPNVPNVEPDIGLRATAMPEHRVATSDGGAVDVRPVVVEARDLITSADQGYDPTLPPRQRERFAADQQVREMSSRLDPERLGMSSEADRGAPIVGPDGMVESGNGRVLAIRQAYAEGGEAAARYRAWAESQGAELGGFSEPVLVRQRLTPLDEQARRDFALNANQPATLAMSASERAMADARSITSDRLGLLRDPNDLSSAANRDFVRSFIQSLPQTEQGALMGASGELSAEGLARVRGAVLAAAYGDNGVLARVTETTNDEIKSISNALVAASPEWAKMRADITAGRVRADVDLTSDLLEAVRRTADLRTARVSLENHLKQIDAFDKLPGPVEAWMRIFYDPTGRRAAASARVATALRYYAQEARKVSAEQGLDLGIPRVTGPEIQRLAASEAAGGAGSPAFQFRERDTGASANRPAGGEPVQRPGTAASGAEPGVRGAGAGGEGTGVVFGPSVSRPLPPAATANAAAVPPNEVLRTLHQQTFDLAEALDVPLRQGRLQSRQALGQYDPSQDVIRARVVADFDTVAHEAGHALERHAGAPLTTLTQQHAAELGPLDYDPVLARVNEGFAEFVSHYLTNSAAAQKEAPAFFAAFRGFMQREQPALFASIEKAQAGYQRWLAAPSGARLDAIVQRTEADTLERSIRKDGFFPTISMMVSRAYELLIDDKAPVVRAIRSIASEAYRASGVRMNLVGKADPEKLARLAARSWQTAHNGLMNGIAPYGGGQRSVALRQALITANGERGLFGTWDNVRLKAFDDYLVGRQLEIDWERFNLGDLPNRPAAINQRDVAQAIQRHEAAYSSFPQAAQQVHDFTRALIKKELDAGLMTQELYNKLIQQKFYVPLYRVMDDKPLAAQGGPTTGSARSEGPGMVDLIKKKGGSDRDIISPTQSIMAQVYLAERAIAHNDIIKAFVGLSRDARKLGALDVGRIIEEIPPHELVGKRFDLAEATEAAGRQNGLKPDDIDHIQTAIIDVFGEDPLLGTIFRHAPTAPHGEPRMFWKEGGQLRAVRLISQAENLGLYEALAGLPPEMRDVAIKAMAVSSSALRIGVTTNPSYALANFVRDQVAATVLVPGYIPLNPMGIIRAATNDRWAQLYARSGGINPGPASIEIDKMIARDIEGLKRKGWVVQQFGAISDLFHPGRVGGIGPAVVGAGRAVTSVIGLSETGTRINIFKRVYQQKKRQGLSDEDAAIEAAHIATDVLDFSRHGSGTLAIRSIWTFLNSNLQGLNKTGRQLIVPLYRKATGQMVLQNDVEALHKSLQSWLVFAGVNAALGYAYGLWAAKDEAYQDAEPRLRATHLIVPGASFDKPGIIGVVPKPFDLAIGFNLGEQAGLDVAKGDPRVYENALTGILEVISLPNFLHPFPGLSTSAELLLNKSFLTGRELVSDKLQAVEPFAQFKTTTSDMSKWIGRQINVAPIKIDHWMGGQFGSWGRDIVHAFDAVDPNRPDIPPENTMFLRRFLKSADVSSQTTQTFWKLASATNGEFIQANNTYKGFIEAQREREALEYLSHLPADKRAYTTLQSAAKEDGLPKFDAEEKRLHPLTRAAAAIKVISGFVDELNINTQREIAANENLSLNSKERREAIDGLRLIQAMEQRNALVILKQRGYEGRRVLSVEDQFAVLRDQVPKVASELADRYASARIYKTDEVARAWPQAQRRLLIEGGDADLKDLALDVRAEGPAFEGARVRGANRRRLLLIPPGMEQEGTRP